MIFRHGLRVSEAITMRLDALNLKQARLTVNRSKNSISTEQPVEGDELRAMGQIQTLEPTPSVSAREEAVVHV
jgi:hypothetical protein